jgi:hypothetical protein
LRCGLGRASATSHRLGGLRARHCRSGACSYGRRAAHRGSAGRRTDWNGRVVGRVVLDRRSDAWRRRSSPWGCSVHWRSLRHWWRNILRWTCHLRCGHRWRHCIREPSSLRSRHLRRHLSLILHLRRTLLHPRYRWPDPTHRRRGPYHLLWLRRNWTSFGRPYRRSHGFFLLLLLVDRIENLRTIRWWYTDSSRRLLRVLVSQKSSLFLHHWRRRSSEHWLRSLVLLLSLGEIRLLLINETSLIASGIVLICKGRRRLLDDRGFAWQGDLALLVVAEVSDRSAGISSWALYRRRDCLLDRQRLLMVNLLLLLILRNSLMLIREFGLLLLNRWLLKLLVHRTSLWASKLLLSLRITLIHLLLLALRLLLEASLTSLLLILLCDSACVNGHLDSDFFDLVRELGSSLLVLSN